MSRISDNQMTGIIGQVLEIDRDFQPTRPEQIGVGRQDAATSPPPNQASVKDIDHSEQAYAPPPPSTAGETARLDVQHGLWARTLCGRLSISPLDNERIHRVGSTHLISQPRTVALEHNLCGETDFGLSGT